ncbi:MAG: HPP family protein [Alphaproteobacteria bacterium]|nr:HPP family protein [Alphaproteobacteria bacterium]
MRASLAAGALILMVGGIGAGLRSPWLFPSLGPTAALFVLHPHQRAARTWNTLVGHAVGVVAGVFAAHAFGVVSMGAALPGPPGLPHVLAAAVATSLTLGGGLLLDADHPPAAATTLLLALGAIPANTVGVLSVGIGVAGTCLLGVPLRRHAERSARAHQEPRAQGHRQRQ